jgi:hypothetical protein
MNARVPCISALGLLLVGCETGGPINSSFDPLDAAGGYGTQANVINTGYRAGEFVTAVMDNTGFYKERPDGEANADKLLKANTSMKVISDDGSFVKVELDTGELGYVSTVQVMGENEGSNLPPGSEVQVWPPVDGGPIPVADPSEADPDVPLVPTDIDPDAPIDEPILPDVAPEDDPAVDIPPLPDPVEAGADEAGEDAAADGEAGNDPAPAAE